MLAPFLAVTIQNLFQQLYPIPSHRFSKETLEKAVELRKRLAGVRRQIQGSRSRQTALIVNRLNYLVKQITDHIQEY
jgi:hypothetical protein